MMRKITCVCIAKPVDKFLGILNSTQKGKEIPGYLSKKTKTKKHSPVQVGSRYLNSYS
jgi:hypothetical protein